MADLFSEMERERRTLLDVISGLDEDLMNRKDIVGDWSIKNLLAHFAGWESWLIQVLPGLLANGEIPEPLRNAAVDEDAWNAMQVIEREELTPGEQVIELERTRAALIEYLHSLDEATLTRPQPWPRWKGTLTGYIFAVTRDHEAAHRKILQAALERFA